MLIFIFRPNGTAPLLFYGAQVSQIWKPAAAEMWYVHNIVVLVRVWPNSHHGITFHEDML